MTAPAIIANRTAPSERVRRDLAAVRHEYVTRARAKLANANEGIAWPYPKLNEQADTMVPGDLIVVSAYTGSGKTTLVQNCAMHWGAQGVKVLLFGTEQPADTLTMKISCMEVGLPFGDARRGRLSAHWAKRLDEQMALHDGPNACVTYYPKSSPTGSQILRAIRASARTEGVSVFIIDYLGHVNLSGHGQHWEQMRKFMSALKDLAGELDVCIIVCAQIGKGDGNGGMARYKKPELGDIQGGTGVMQEADVVWGLFQPLKPGVKPSDMAEVHTGEKHIWDVVEPNTAAVALLKYREGDRDINTVSMYWVRHNRFTPRKPGEIELPQELRLTEYWREKSRCEWVECVMADEPAHDVFKGEGGNRAA